MSERANDFFDSEEEFQKCLDLAEEKASTDWEVKFVDSIQMNVGNYGMNIYMTESQYEQLKRISEK